MFSNLLKDWYRGDSPVRAFTSLDFQQLFQDIISYAQENYPQEVWSNFSPASFEVMFSDLTAWMGEYMLHMLDVRVRETNPLDMVEYDNFLRWARMFSFFFSGPTPAKGELTLTLDPAALPITINKHHVFSANGTPYGTINFYPDYADPGLIIPSTPYTIDIVEGEMSPQAGELLGVSDGTPFQEYQLPRAPVVSASLEVFVGIQRWTREDNLGNYTSTSQNYSVAVDFQGNLSIKFGDGVYGAIPPITENVLAFYATSLGSVGNTAADTITGLSNVPNGVLSCTNADVSGSRQTGLDSESLIDAKKRLSYSLGSQERLITVEDFRLFVEAYFAGSKARYFAGAGPNEPRLVVALYGYPPAQLTTGQKNNLLRDMADIKYIGVYPFIEDAFIRELEWDINLYVRDNFRSEDVKSYVEDKILNQLDTGWFNFPYLEFAGRDSDDQLVFSLTNMYSNFKNMYDAGVERVLFTIFRPIIKHRFYGVDETNKAPIVLNILDDNDIGRRQWVIVFTAPRRYTFFKRDVGRATYVGTDTLYDNSKSWVGSLAGLSLYPNAEIGIGPYTIVSNTANSVTVSAADIATYGELHVWARPETPYYIETEEATGVASDGGPYTNLDNTLQIDFTYIPPPAQEFDINDRFEINSYNVVDDIDLENDEFPTLDLTNVNITTFGGIE